MLRQYFMGLRTVGKWRNLAQHWKDVADKCDIPMSPGTKTKFNIDFPTLSSLSSQLPEEKQAGKAVEETTDPWEKFLNRRFSHNVKPFNDDSEESDVEEEQNEKDVGGIQLDFEILLMRKFWTKWALKAGVKTGICDPLKEGEFTVDWTRCIAPVTEGRIKMVGA